MYRPQPILSWISVILGPLLLLLGGAGPLAAQSAHLVEVEPVVGDGFFLEPLSGSLLAPGTEHLTVEPRRRGGLAYGIRARARIISFLSLQVSYAAVSVRTIAQVDSGLATAERASSEDYLQGGIRAQIPPGAGVAQPYVEAGAGFAQGPNYFGWHLGTGVRFRTDGFADVVLGARDYMWISDAGSAFGRPDRLQHDLLVTAGLTFGLF